MVVTYKGPEMVLVDVTVTEPEVVAPDPDMFSNTGLLENVRLWARAVSGLPSTAAATVRRSRKGLYSLFQQENGFVREKFGMRLFHDADHATFPAPDGPEAVRPISGSSPNC